MADGQDSERASVQVSEPKLSEETATSSTVEKEPWAPVRSFKVEAGLQRVTGSLCRTRADGSKAPAGVGGGCAQSPSLFGLSAPAPP